MNDDERDISGLLEHEEELALRLARLGPLMREQEQAEAEIDQAFARTLRAHLVYGEERAPHPGFARNLRSRLMIETTSRPLTRTPRWRPALLTGGAATVVALLAGLLIAVLSPRGSQAPSFGAPYPTRADLIFSFPAPQTVIHLLTPTLSLVHPRPGVPYAGHLRLTASRLPTEPSRLPAYRLASPTGVMATGRRLLDIRSPVRHVVSGSATWAVAAEGGFPSRRPLHSLAVSLATGELIYHDRRNLVLPRARKALPRSAAVAVARQWLVRLGWPGNQMPLLDVQSVKNAPKVREVEFGWIGVGTTATDAATLWVTPNRSVIEAWVWPPVVRGGTVPASPLSAAWAEVRAGHVPLAVEGVKPSARANGVGVVRRTIFESILSFGARGALYLVPVYRFEGNERSGAEVHTWFSLAPGARR